MRLCVSVCERSVPQANILFTSAGARIFLGVCVCLRVFVFPPTQPGHAPLAPAATLKCSFPLRMAPGVFYFYCNFWHNSLPLVLVEFLQEIRISCSCCRHHGALVQVFKVLNKIRKGETPYIIAYFIGYSNFRLFFSL